MGNCSRKFRRGNVRPPTPPKGRCYQEKKISEPETETAGEQTNLWSKTIPFVPPVNGGNVIKVYDGDTITIASTLNGMRNSPLYRFSVRLDGIDTPEIKGGKNENEKTVAIMARDALRGKILNKHVELRNVKTEKYGRLLAEVWYEGKNINKWMIQERYAILYDGGTKHSPEDWLAFYNGN